MVSSTALEESCFKACVWASFGDWKKIRPRWRHLHCRNDPLNQDQPATVAPLDSTTILLANPWWAAHRGYFSPVASQHRYLSWPVPSAPCRCHGVASATWPCGSATGAAAVPVARGHWCMEWTHHLAQKPHILSPANLNEYRNTMKYYDSGYAYVVVWVGGLEFWEISVFKVFIWIKHVSYTFIYCIYS